MSCVVYEIMVIKCILASKTLITLYVKLIANLANNRDVFVYFSALILHFWDHWINLYMNTKIQSYTLHFNEVKFSYAGP